MYQSIQHEVRPACGLSGLTNAALGSGMVGFASRVIWLSICVGLLTCAISRSAEITLKNGMALRGRVDQVSAIAENPLTPDTGSNTRSIAFVDDQLRRTFFPFRQIANTREDAPEYTPIRIQQPIARSGPRLGAVGNIRLTPFTERGRRTVTITTARGQKKIVQGITEITPVYTRLQTLLGDAITWDMRIATSSIPSDTLREVLLNNSQNKGADARRDIVRLLFQSERYQDAARELQQAMKEFPELKELESLQQELVQRGEQLLIDEIKLRQAAGQHQRTRMLLANFPTEATENLIRVRELAKEYDTAAARGKQVLQQMQQLISTVEDEGQRKQIELVYAEMQQELNYNNVGRMSAFLRLAGQPADQQLALAASLWLLGQGVGTENLAVATSLYEVRNLVREYLRLMGEENRHARQELLTRMGQLEGSTPEYVAQLLKGMKPPHDLPEDATQVPGYFEVTVPHKENSLTAKYSVQLPPEYDPYRRYPAVVTLHGAGSQPDHQIQWWAGEYNEQAKRRAGLASRYGYIVIAPQWAEPGQTSYQYSAREHALVVRSLRDAMRRFSVDADRVFLSGHSMGGDAAWDIGLAHPSLWAGLIPIVARADYGQTSSPKYVRQYYDNARRLPMYFVFGELDGNRLAENAGVLNRYMRYSDFDVVVVQYLGRGHEHFYDEIQRIFTWMQLQPARDFFPQEFQCVTMRPWDDFFWYLELEDLPNKSIVLPVSWPPPRGNRAMESSFRVANNRISLSTGAGTSYHLAVPRNRRPAAASDRLREGQGLSVRHHTGGRNIAGRRSHACRSSARILGQGAGWNRTRPVELATGREYLRNRYRRLTATGSC